MTFPTFSPLVYMVAMNQCPRKSLCDHFSNHVGLTMRTLGILWWEGIVAYEYILHHATKDLEIVCILQVTFIIKKWMPKINFKDPN